MNAIPNLHSVSAPPGRRPHGAHSLAAAAVAAIILLGACSPNAGDLGTVATPPPTPGASVDVPSAEPTAGTNPSSGPSADPSSPAVPSASPNSTTTTVRAYFFLGSFTHPAGLAPVLREIPRTQAVATAAMQALIAGPTPSELAARPAMYTTVPDGTRLLGLSISNGIATVNLSREFETGGGSASVLGRLGQVVYTLTQFRTVQRVTFQLDGQPVTVFSSEGIVLDHAVARSDYTGQLPAIWVDRPAWGAALGNPARVTGLANVFEASFRIALLDGPMSAATPATLADQQVMASCGTGCWGTFDVTLHYAATSAHWGTLRVYDLSARDGTPENVTDYPVWLTPAG